MPINTFHRSETTNKLQPQRQARVPPPVTSSYITPPVVKCNHIFRKSSSSAREKRLYHIHTHCHYPAQVVSAHYLWPLKFSQHAIDSMKITRQLQWCVEVSPAVLSPQIVSPIVSLRCLVGNVIFIFAVVKIPHM